jgi:hypothetical protein
VWTWSWSPSRLQRGGGVTFWWLHLAPTRNPPEELFCQTFFKTTQLHQRSHSTRGARAEAVIGGAGALPNRPLLAATRLHLSGSHLPPLVLMLIQKNCLASSAGSREWHWHMIRSHEDNEGMCCAGLILRHQKRIQLSQPFQDDKQYLKLNQTRTGTQQACAVQIQLARLKSFGGK